MDYPIYQGLWESIDAVLFNKGITLAKDIAAELGVSPQPLIEMLKKEERKFTLIPDEDPLYQCKALVHRGASYMRCRCPTLGNFCNSHAAYSDVPKLGLQTMQRLVTPDSVYLMEEGSSVFTLDGDLRGTLKGTTLTLFDIVT